MTTNTLPYSPTVSISYAEPFTNEVYKSTEWEQCRDHDELCVVKDIMDSVDKIADLLADNAKLHPDISKEINDHLCSILDRLDDGCDEFDEAQGWERRYDELQSAVQYALDCN